MPSCHLFLLEHGAGLEVKVGERGMVEVEGEGVCGGSGVGVDCEASIGLPRSVTLMVGNWEQMFFWDEVWGHWS